MHGKSKTGKQYSIKSKYSDVSFSALLISRYWKFITLSKIKHFLFVTFQGNDYLPVVISLLQLQVTQSDGFVVIQDKLTQVQSMTRVIFHYLQRTKIKIFPVSKSTTGKIRVIPSFSLQNVEKSKDVLVLKAGNNPDVWSPCKKI